MRVFATGWSEGFDGPGRRWVVYLKGCNLRCRWCASPESIEAQPQILFSSARAHNAAGACPYKAVVAEDGDVRLDRDVCRQCTDHHCVRAARHPAFQLVGEDRAVQDLVAQAVSHRALYGTHGGVTFGGGEPSLQSEELASALRQLREGSVHVAVESNVSTAGFRDIAADPDLLICDLKCLSPELVTQWTGGSSQTIRDNLAFAADHARDLWVRVPVVSGLNDGGPEWDRIAAVIRDIAKARKTLHVELIPMHHLGAPKYAQLGIPYSMAGYPCPTLEQVENMCAALQHPNITTAVARSVRQS